MVHFSIGLDRRKATLPINHTTLRLHKAQDGRCAICTGTLNAVEDQPQLPQQWEHWLATTRTAIIRIAPRVGTPDEAELRLIHAHCHHGSGPAYLPAYTPTGLA